MSTRPSSLPADIRGTKSGSGVSIPMIRAGRKKDAVTTAALSLERMQARSEEDPDILIVRAMAEQDPEALDALYARHGSGIFSYLIGRLSDRQLAEEVLQDVMLAAWRSAASFRGDAKVRTWLLTIAHHRAINARRKRRVETVELDPRLADRRAEGAQGGRATSERLDLRRALRQLPTEHRSALELVFFHELSIAEAAAVLDVAPGTVKSRLHRAKAMLRERLAPPEPKSEAAPDPEDGAASRSPKHPESLES